MPSQAMQDVIEAFRDGQKAGTSQAPPTLEERRAAFAPGGRLHPVPDDVLALAPHRPGPERTINSGGRRLGRRRAHRRPARGRA